MFEKFSDKVTISSVHKKHLLKMFDYVIYFEKGKVERVEKVI